AGARHLAREAVADAHRDRRRNGLAFLDDVEVVIEGRDLEDLGLRELHLGGQRREMRRAQVAEAVLQLVQVLDEEIARARRVAEQREHVGERLRVDAPAAWRLALALARSGLGNDRDDGGTVHDSAPASARKRSRAAPHLAPTGTWRRAPRPGSRSSTRTPECRARRGTAPPPRPRRRRRATPPPA